METVTSWSIFKALHNQFECKRSKKKTLQKKIYKLFCEKIIHIVWRLNLYLIIICEVGRRVNIMPIL